MSQEARAQTKLGVPVGLDIIDPLARNGDDAGPPLGLYGGVAFSPLHLLAFAVTGAYDPLTSYGCNVAVSGFAGGGGCAVYVPFRIMASAEVRPVRGQYADPFLRASLGAFGEHVSITSDSDPKVVPSFGLGGGVHVYPVPFLSVDFALEFFYAAFPTGPYGIQEFARPWLAFSLGVTPWISF